MATYNKFNATVENLAEKVFNLGSDTLKVALSNTLPVAANSQLSNITQIANGNGYTTGGSAAVQTLSSQTAGLYTLKCSNVVFTATGAVGPFQYVILYDDTATNDELIGWWDYGSTITMANGDTFTVAFDSTNGVLTIQ